MNDQLVLVIIPSETVRDELLRDRLPEFGKSPSHTVAAVSGDGCAFLPASGDIDLLLISDRNLEPPLNSAIAHLTTTKKFIYVAYHEGADIWERKYLTELQARSVNLVYEKFNRSNAHPLFTNLRHLCTSTVPEEYQKYYRELVNCFKVDWELEMKIARFHGELLPPDKLKLPAHTLLIWNPNSFAEGLKQCLPSGAVVTSPQELPEMLNGINTVWILAELAWKHKKYSQFYGYDLARDLIAKNLQMDLAFVSCLSRECLKTVNASAQLLVPIFPHFKLPWSSQQQKYFQIPPFSKTKWEIIRNYYLKPDGIVDKLIHQIKKLGPGSRISDIEETLQQIQTYEAILSSEIVALNNRLCSSLQDEPQAIYQDLPRLQTLMENYYYQIVSPEPVPAKRCKDNLLIVEDDPETLDRLTTELGSFFGKVRGFRCGTKALQELEKNPRFYAAAIVDMELLDQRGFWQPLQGFDLIERARLYPHLVIYMLTGYSRRALTHVQGDITAGEIRYQAKGSNMELPPHFGYAQLSAKIQEQIQSHRKYLTGPTKGVWKNGLLQFYYQFRESKEGADLWPEAIAVAERFIREDHNQNGNVPRQFFHVNTKDFKPVHLRTILVHRLIVLYYDFSQTPIPFEKALKQKIGFKTSSPKQYFTSLLGFSAVCKKEEGDKSQSPTLCKIQRRNLFPEELEWLGRRFPPIPPCSSAT